MLEYTYIFSFLGYTSRKICARELIFAGQWQLNALSLGEHSGNPLRGWPHWWVLACTLSTPVPSGRLRVTQAAYTQENEMTTVNFSRRGARCCQKLIEKACIRIVTYGPSIPSADRFAPR